MALKEKINYLISHRFVQSVALLQVANIAGNFIQALIGIFIARILQPEQYGVYAVAFGLAALVYISTGVQETITIALSEAFVREDRSASLNALAFFLRFSLLFAGITLVIAAFLPRISLFFYHDYKIGIYAAIVVVASIISSLAFSMSTMMLQVAGDIKKMAGLIFTDQVLRFGLSLSLVAAGYGLTGAALGHLIGAVIIFVISLLIWRYAGRRHKLIPSIRELFKAMRTAHRSPHFSKSIWVTIDKNFALAYTILPVLLAGLYLSKSEVSYFKLAFGFVTLALSLLGPISMLLNSELSRIQVENPERTKKNFVKVSWYSVGISTLLTLAAIIIAPTLFKFLYGPSYLPSVKYIPGLAIYGIFYGIGVGLGPMWRIVNRVKISIVINLIVLGLGIPAGLYLIRHYGVWGGIIMVTAWYTISHFISFFYLSAITD